MTGTGAGPEDQLPLLLFPERSAAMFRDKSSVTHPFLQFFLLCQN
jgi:hypothetical protein